MTCGKTITGGAQNRDYAGAFVDYEALAEASECPYHPSSRYRECHHVGEDFVAVWWSEGMGDWVSTYGTIGKRGSMSAFAAKELVYMLERLRS
jgi:hypothetical protein